MKIFFIPLLVFYFYLFWTTDLIKVYWGGWGPSMTWVLLYVVTISLGVTYGLLLKSRPRQQKLLAAGFTVATFAAIFFRIFYLEFYRLSFLDSDQEVNRAGFYCIHLMLICIALFSKVWPAPSDVVVD